MLKKERDTMPAAVIHKLFSPFEVKFGRIISGSRLASNNHPVDVLQVQGLWRNSLPQGLDGKPANMSLHPPQVVHPIKFVRGCTRYRGHGADIWREAPDLF